VTDFQKSDTVRRFKFDAEVRAFDANGGEHRFTPECHVSYSVCYKSSPINQEFQFEGRVTQLKTFFDRLEAGHVDGEPLHIANPEKSSFDIISFVEFQGLSTPQIQDRLRHKNVVITGCPHPNINFDEVGLRALSPLSRKISIQGTNSTSSINRHITHTNVCRPLYSRQRRFDTCHCHWSYARSSGKCHPTRQNPQWFGFPYVERRAVGSQSLCHRHDRLGLSSW
jgi:hypothetical protein